MHPIPTLPGEEVLPIPNWPGYYVTTLGRVWSSKSDRFLRPSVSSNGYLVVSLSHVGRRQSFTVHGLVVRAFLGPKPPSMEVNHRDGNRINNRLDNLEYVTRRYNIRHAFALQLYRRDGVHNARARLTPDQVIEIRQCWASGGWTHAELARSYGVNRKTIGDIIHSRTWRCLNACADTRKRDAQPARTAA